ncbi:MAG: PAS domain S-box protein [bacterium]
MFDRNDGAPSTLDDVLSSPILSGVLSSISDAVYVTDPVDGTILFANESALDQTGYSRSELLQTAYLDVESLKGLTSWQEVLEQIGDSDFSNPVEFEGDRKCADSFRRGVEVSGFSASSEPGELVVFVSTLRDDSVWIDRSNGILGMYEEAFNSQFEFKGILAPSGKIIEFNRKARKFVAMTSEELRGRSFLELFVWEQAGTTEEVINKALSHARSGEMFRETLDAVDHEGNTRKVDFALSPVFDDQGSVKYLLVEGRDISTLVQTERELRVKQHRLQDISENINEVIWMFTADWSELLFINEQQYESLWGGDVSELKGDPTSFLNQVHPEDREEIVTAMEDVGEGQDREIEIRVDEANNYETWVSVSGYYLEASDTDQQPRVMGTVQDITERVSAYRQLQEREELFREMAETINEVFWVTDPQKEEMIYVSPAFRDIWGYDVQDLYDNESLWFEVIHPEDRPEIVNKLPEAQIQGEYDEEYRIKTADGETRWIHDKAFPVKNEDGTVVRVLGIAEDITERVENEREVRKKEKLASIGEMAAGVMHEINNPNGFIQGNVEFLRKTWEKIESHLDEIPLDQDTLDYWKSEFPDVLDSIYGGTKRIETIVNNVKRFARESQESPEASTTLENACGTLDRLLQERQTQFPSVQIEEYVCDVPDSLNVSLGDEDFETIVSNLMDNAFHAVEDVDTPTISLGLQLRDENLRFWIEDNGEGIADEDLSQVTDPFFSTKSKAKGTGLGLSITATILERVGGKLNIDSELGTGTRIGVRIPLSN